MKTQDLLLVALVIGGLYFLTRKKKGGAVGTKSASSGGGAVGGGVGTSPVGVDTSDIDVTIQDTGDLPSKMDCVKNPDLYGCGEVLPVLATQQGKEDALGEVLSATSTQGGDYGSGVGVSAGMGSGGYGGDVPTDPRNPRNPVGTGLGGIDLGGGVDLGHGSGGGDLGGGDFGTGTGGATDIGSLGDVSTDVRGTSSAKGYAVLNPSGATRTTSGKYIATSKAPSKEKKFTGSRMDVPYEEEISMERRRGRKDKFDFDGEYGTFIEDSF